jgi:hypothetical protein
MELYLHTPYIFMVQCLIKHRDFFFNVISAVWSDFSATQKVATSIKNFKTEHEVFCF